MRCNRLQRDSGQPASEGMLQATVGARPGPHPAQLCRAHPGGSRQVRPPWCRGGAARQALHPWGGAHAVRRRAALTFACRRSS